MTAKGVVFEAKVGVVHRTFGEAFERNSKQVAQPKIRSLCATFVVETRFVSGNEAAAACDKLPELSALRVGESRSVRQDERFELPDVLRVKQVIVNHLERNARL